MRVRDGSLIALLALGCTGEPPATEPFVEPRELACPRPGWVPRTADWTSTENQNRAVVHERIKHEAMDILGIPGGMGFRTDFEDDAAGQTGVIDWTASVAVGLQSRGFESFPLPGEPVSSWVYTRSWIEQEAAVSGEQGEVSFTGVDEPGLVERTLVLEPQQTCAHQVALRLEPGAQVVLTDIDGTLTISDDELFLQINDGAYDPLAYEGGAAMLQLWVEKGIQPVYMSARPHVLRAETRSWLAAHGYPQGPVITSNALVIGGATVGYKTAWVERLVHDLSWDLVAAYGNAETDIEAYLAGGIPAEQIFIIGENAGKLGTVAIDTDWVSHTESFVRPF